MEALTINCLLRKSFQDYGDKNSLQYTDEAPYTYNELNKDINKLLSLFDILDLKKGDKIAILSQNMPNWGKAYLAIAAMGGVVVPILPDFHPDEVSEILKHSEAKALFVSESLFPKIQEIETPTIQHMLLLDRFTVIPEKTSLEELKQLKDQLQNIRPVKSVYDYDYDENHLLSIIYTSGTTGKSKGVMLSHKNIVFMAKQVTTIQPIGPDDRFLSLLPLSHTYENSLGFIYPMMYGASVYYLKKAPTAPVLLPALKKIKPTMILSVPLIIEKIYFKSVKPNFEKKKLIKALYQFSPIRKLLHKLAGKKLIKTFGGEVKFFGIGGSKLDGVVEKFLREAKFPYAIGYGLTETAPLLAGANPQKIKYRSTGPAMEGVSLRIFNPDPQTGEGEIQAKGDNVMLGYYKDEEATKSVFTDDGWFKTGDLGVMDDDNYVYIKGRLKNMIVTAKGENIYPEEIESVINNMNYVKESLVIEAKGKLVGLVHLDYEAIEEHVRNLALNAKTNAQEFSQNAKRLYS